MAQATKKIRAKIRLFVAAGLGPRQLRADTAAGAAPSLWQAAPGDRA